MQKFRNFRAKGKEYVIKLLDPPPNTNMLEWVEGGFRDLTTHITESCNPYDYVGFTVNFERLNNGPVWSRPKHARDYTPNDLWSVIKGISQSTGGLSTSDTIIITVAIVTGVEGSGRKRLTYEDIFKRSILTITNDDNLCLPRSLVVAKLYAERGEIRVGSLQTRWKAITNRSRTTQKKEAVSLIQKCRVNIPPKGCGIPEIQKFQNYYLQYQTAIVVYEFLTFGKGAPPIFDGRPLVNNRYNKIKHTLSILYYERTNHYQPILNLQGAVAGRGFCNMCNKAFTDNIEHRCARRCPRCKAYPLCRNTGRMSCRDCNRWFFNRQCYHNHLKRGSANIRKNRDASVCDVLRICQHCFKMIRLGKHPHQCGITYCRTCRDNRPVQHFCFMKPLKTIEHKLTMFIFYDFETQQNVRLRGNWDVKLHIPNFCVVQRVCSLCCNDNEIENPCGTCGVRQFIFRNRETAISGLIDIVFGNYKNKFQNIICLAHNARSFDAQFILRYLVDVKRTQFPNLILNGTKIIEMRIANIVFLDTLNYFHMPLANLPKSFGFEDEVIKGYFPHLFNTPENQNYVGPIPEIKYYSPDTMFTKEYTKFQHWYQTHLSNNHIFNFKKELEFYCRKDVTILRRSSIIFRNNVIEKTGICPYTQCSTIASVCSKVFRTICMNPDTIGILPQGGVYRYSSTQSRKAISWLLLEERRLNHSITHAGNSKEYRLPCGLMVDGFYEDPNGIKYVFQFYGCFWHGCTACFKINRHQVLRKSDSLDSRYECTILTAHKIRWLGYHLIEIWECVFDARLTNSRDDQIYLENHAMLKHDILNPRDAFFGGRTENYVTLYDIKDSEKIKYFDVTSLYPWVNKTGKYPLGHPKIYVGDECRTLIGNDNNLDCVEGLVKCTVLPPRDLYIPVLPYRAHGRLMFPLCRSCCEMLNQDPCDHDLVSDRQFSGTWVVDELRKAVEHGYQIENVTEIYQYEMIQYDREHNKDGLFNKYVDKFLKEKQEASDYPHDCQSDEEKDAYIQEYFEKEGVLLEKHRIKHNPGYRALSKMILNAFWGKFGQRENLPQTEIVSTRNRLLEMLNSPELIITGLLPVNERVMYVNYVYKDDSVLPTPTANVVIAAYTTAQARLKLYSYLERLNRRVLYCDTDSVIFVSKNGEWEPPCGKFLGDLTDELEEYGNGSYIQSFVSGGPKFYAYLVHTPNGEVKEVCKVKGITLNYNNSRYINYQSVRDLITGVRREPIVLTYDAIRRTEYHQVITRKEIKATSVCSTKRRCKDRYRTVPFGYASL